MKDNLKKLNPKNRIYSSIQLLIKIAKMLHVETSDLSAMKILLKIIGHQTDELIGSKIW